MRGEQPMNERAFDAKAFVEFDLQQGLIRSRNRETLALIPLDVLSALPLNDEADRAVRKWGRVHGEQFANSVLSEEKSEGVESLIDHLGATTAALGFGRLSMEFYGDALVFRARSEAVQSRSHNVSSLLGSFIAGYLSAVIPRAFEVSLLGEQEGDQLFWAGNAETSALLEQWIIEGMAPLNALHRLMKGGA